MNQPTAAKASHVTGAPDTDNLYHLFCDNPGTQTRCGKTNTAWVTTSTYQPHELCRVCWEMWHTGHCAHCTKGTTGGN